MHTQTKAVSRPALLGTVAVGVVFTALLLCDFGQTAQADLAAIGSVDPPTAFPSFVQDAQNVQIGSCDCVDPVNQGGDIVNKMPC